MNGADRPGSSRSRRSRSTARDIERYAALFASRTRVMKSSAMRDLMALTERPEVISLAGGWPDTSTFPPDSYAALMSDVAGNSCARALQYGPTEGLMLVKQCVAEVMRSEGMEIDVDEVLVTTGGPSSADASRRRRHRRNHRSVRVSFRRQSRACRCPGCRRR